MPQSEIVDQKPFYMGNWLINPAKNQIQNDLITQSIQPKLIEVLTYLCSKQGAIVSSDELINHCWKNQYISDNPVHKCIAQLRKVLGDSTKKPEFIITVPKRGYSVIAKVSLGQDTLTTIEPFWFNSSPFNGLKKYTMDQQNIFFGRTKEINDVLSLIDNNHLNHSSLIMLLGKSGCGKSSLVQAGIIPKLIHPYKPFKNEYVESHTYCPSINQGLSVIKTFLAFLFEHKIIGTFKNSKYEEQSLEKVIQNLSDYINPKFIKSHDNDANKKCVIIFIDQLENIFSNELNSQESEGLFKIIIQLLNSLNCLILCAMRNEYYQELIESSCYLKLKTSVHHYDVPPLSYDDISDVVRNPAQAAGLIFETDPDTHVSLDSYIINKAQSINVSLPILQHTLSELYKNRKGKKLTYKVYKNNGGMEGGLSRMAENAFLELSSSAQERFEQLLHNLIQINPERNKKAICKKTAIKSFVDNDSKKIIETFINKRLFQTEWINNEPFLSIIHDVLIEHWDRLQKWVIKNTALLNTQHEVKIATNSWIMHGKNKDFLFNSLLPVTAANNIKKNKHIHLSEDEMAFIKSSNNKYSYAKILNVGLMSTLVIMLFVLSVLIFSINTKNDQIIKTKNNAESLISFILFDLKDKLTPLGRIDLLELVGSKTNEYFSTIEKQNLSSTSINHWIEALHIIGEASFTQGDYEKSYQSFLKANEMLTRAALKDPKNINVAEKYMLGNYWLGYLNLVKEDFLNSEKYLKEYLISSQKMSVQQPQVQKWKLETSYAFNNLGTLSVSTNQLKKANDYFNNSIAIKKQLLEQSPQNQVLIADLADSISWVGVVKEKEGNLTQNLAINVQALELLRELITLNPNNPQWRHRLSIALHRAAFIHYDFGDINQSKIIVTEAIETLQELVDKDKENFILKKELIFNYLLLVKINRHQGINDKGLFYIQKSQGLLDVFKTNLKYSKKIASYNINLILEQSIIMNKLNQNESALQSIQKAEVIWQDYFANEAKVSINEAAQIDLALINLTKFNLLSTSNSLKNLNLLKPSLNSLKSFIIKNPNHYKTIALYLKILKRTNNLENDNRLEQRLKLANYRNPDFTPTDSENKMNKTNSQQPVEISLSQ